MFQLMSSVIRFKGLVKVYLNSGRKKVLKLYFEWVMEFAGLDY